MIIFDKKAWKTSKLILITLVTFISIVMFVDNGIMMIYAKDKSTTVTGDYYEFEEKSHYEFSSVEPSADTVVGENTIGKLTLSGDLSEDGGTNSIPTYFIKDGNLDIAYEFDKSLLNQLETEWHLIDDKSKEVDNIKLDDNIMQGALILQSSLDGETWTDDVTQTNIFAEDTDFDETFYTTKDIQQQNGCYFRVIIAYEMEITTGSKKVVFVNVDVTDDKKVAEIYKFYVVDKEISSATSASDTPRKELGKKINTGKDNGYSESSTIDKDDPHYGWDLGTFFVNGYTRESKEDNGTPVFLKNVGDKVTLWFTLEQDINNLNENSDLTIAEDTNGYDKVFEVAQTNFGHGTLMIRYTDYEGVVHDPVIYTNYLAANAKTSADTRVQLFEEGDYEVILDYEIKNDPRKVGSISVVPIYTNYKIFFTFSIRNGNNMVYPFDTNTGGELTDNAITENGFKLDMAKSRYLTIDVTKSVLNVGSEGVMIEDIRFNRPAKDGEAYTDEGIYTFSVKNLYTDGDSTTKTIYVGMNKYLLLLSKSGLSLAELNEKIALGAEVTEDGTIVEPVEEIITTVNEEIEETDESETGIVEIKEVKETVTAVEPTTVITTGAENDVSSALQSTSSMPLYATIIIAALGIALVLVFIKQKFAKNNSGKDDNK